MQPRSLSVLLALTCSIHAPALARAVAPVSVDQRAEAAFDAEQFLRAATLLAGALADLPENPANRAQRNAWAAGALNAYNRAYEAATTECEIVLKGLEVADGYLEQLVGAYGEQVTSADEHTGIKRLRDALEQAGTEHNCPPMELLPPSPPAPEPEPPVQPTPAPTSPTPPPRSAARGLVAGLAASAALSVGMAVGSVITYTQLRKPDGRYYAAIFDASGGAFGYEAWQTTDLCAVNRDNAAVVRACSDWTARKRLFSATTALAGVFAVSAAVFTGLLIHQRRRPAPGTALLRRHQAQLGLMPHLGGGVSLRADLRF